MRFRSAMLLHARVSSGLSAVSLCCSAGEPVSWQAPHGASQPDGGAGRRGHARAGAALHGPCGALCSAQGAFGLLLWGRQRSTAAAVHGVRGTHDVGAFTA